jgi:two-component system, NarL family, nitrate/nitrite response regulator NarL
MEWTPSENCNPPFYCWTKAFGSYAVMDRSGALRKSDYATAVLVWGSAVPEAESLRFLQAGAAAVLRKTSRLDVQLTCLRKVAHGATWIEDQLETERPHPAWRTAPLTARELQVMELVERGMKNKDIGDTLGIRTGTVKIHLKHIFEKTGIRGRYGLALSGLKEKGLLVPALIEM